MNVYKAVVSISGRSLMQEEYFVPAESITEAVKILEEGRHQFFEGQPLHIMSVQQMEGKWLLPKDKK